MVVQWKILGGDIVTMNMCLPEKNGREGREYTKGWGNLEKFLKYMQIMATVR